MNSSINITPRGTNIHISFAGRTVVIPETQGFLHENETLEIGEISIPCSEKKYSEFKKKYHKAIKPKRAGHTVWAFSTFLMVTMITFSLLLLGLSQQVPNDELAGQNNPILNQNIDQPSSNTPLHQEKNPKNYFPFGNS